MRDNLSDGHERSEVSGPIGQKYWLEVDISCKDVARHAQADNEKSVIRVNEHPLSMV